jgi:hypothetical protein
MDQNNDKWLRATQATAKTFIETFYSSESSLFDMFWDAFSSHIRTIEM